MLLINKRQVKAQSFSEVSILLSLVVIGLIGMQVYVKRGLQARYKSAVDAAVDMTCSASNVEFLRQYEPYYQKETSDFSVKALNGEELKREKGRRKIIQKQYSYQEGNLFSKEGVDFEKDDIWE